MTGNPRAAFTNRTRGPAGLIGTLFTVIAVMVSLLALGSVPSAQAALPAPTDPSPANGAEVRSIPAFAWAPVAEAVGYRIQVATDSAFTSVRYQADVTSPHAAPRVDFTPGTYYWRVRPAASDGSGEYGTTWRFERMARPGPTLVSPTDGQVLNFPGEAPVLRWHPLGEVIRYEVQLSTSDTFPAGSTRSFTTSAASYALPTLEPQDRSFHWRVRGEYLVATRTGTDEAFTEWSNRGQPGTAPSFRMAWNPSSAPALISPARNANPDLAVNHPRFAWAPVQGAAKYRIQISAAPDFTDIRIDREVGRTSYVGPGTLQAGAYYWRVAALDQNSSRGPWSEAERVFYRAWLGFDGQPARPALTAHDADPTTPAHEMPRDEFLVQWTPLPGASHYEVEISDNPAFSVPKIICKTPHTALTPVRYGGYKRTKQLKPEGCDFSRNSHPTGFDIQDHATVYVRVRGVDVTTGDGSYPNGPNVTEAYSAWSNQARKVGDPVPSQFAISFIHQVPGGPEQPASLTGPPDGSSHTQAPVLSWDPVEGARFYRVALSTDRGFSHYESGDATDFTYVVVPGTRLALLESLLDNRAGQSYYWYVLPCRDWRNKADYDCRVGDEQAVNVQGRFRSFHKVAPAPETGQPPPPTGDDVLFQWQDLLASGQAAGGVTYYELEVSTDPDFGEGKRVLLTRTDATQFVPAQHTPSVAWNEGETYYFRVRGYDGGGNPLAWSTDRCVGGGRPCSFVYHSGHNPPAGLTETGEGPIPTLTWTPTAAAASYEIQVFTGQEGGFPLGNLVMSGTSAYPAWTPPATLAAGKYSWRVRKVDTYGAKGAWSNHLSGDWTFDVATAKVSDLAPVSGSSKRVPDLHFTWSSLPGAARYEIQVSTADDFASIYDSAVTTNTSWSPLASEGEYAAGRYYWRVRALNAAATANVLSTTDPQVLDVTSRPAQVRGLRVHSVGKGEVTLTWNSPADGGSPVRQYWLWSRVEGMPWGDFVRIRVPDGQRVELTTVRGLASDTDYEFRLAAVNDLGPGPDSATVDASTPGVPRAPRVTVSARDHGLRVSWSSASSRLPITGYQVWYKPAKAATWTKRVASRSPLELTGLSPTASYQVQVAAMNGAGLGAFGTVTPIRPLAAPSAPRAVTLRHSSRKVTVSWAPPLNAGSSSVTSYLVSHRRATSTTWSTRLARSRSLELNLTAGQTYVLHVAARNAVGTGIASPDQRFVVRATPGRPAAVSGRVTGRKKLRTMALSWTPPSVGAPLISYEVQVSLNGTRWSTIARPKTTSCAWRKARKGRIYLVRVRAYNSLGWGSYSFTQRVRA